MKKITEQEHIQDWHGKMQACTNLEYTKNKIHETIARDLTVCCTEKSDEHKPSGLDLFNTKDLSRNSFNFIVSTMVQKIEQKKSKILFNRDKSEFTKEWFVYINEILNEAVEYYTTHLLRNIGDNFVENKNKKWGKIHFTSTEEVWKFFNYPALDKENWSPAKKQIYCSLLKIAYAINDIKTNEDMINTAEEEFWEIKQNVFFSQFLDYKWQEASESIKNEENNFRYIKLQTKCEKSMKRNIIFNCAGRVKRKEQILVKEISDPKYDSVEVIKDIYGIRNEVKTREDALFLLEYMWIHILKRSGEISYKNIFGNNLEESQRFVRAHAGELDPEFYAEVYKSLKEDTTPGKNNKDYKDVKIRGDLSGHSCEIQINLVDNKNETGYSHHLIFDCKKKIRALSRLQGYISEILIRRYIKEAIEKSIEEAKKYWWHAELVGLGGYHGSVEKITKEHIMKAENTIFDYLFEEEKDILKLEIPGVNANLHNYISRSTWNHFHKWGKYVNLFPKWAMVKAGSKGERTNKEVKV